MIRKEFIDKEFGFPVHLGNVPMVRVRGVWTPKIDYSRLAEVVLHFLACKPSRLTGAEVKFIRTHFQMTLQKFAKRFCVTHVAVLKWERAGGQATVMSWTTEKDVRLFIFSKLQVKATAFAELYAQLEAVRPENPQRLDLGVSWRS